MSTDSVIDYKYLNNRTDFNNFEDNYLDSDIDEIPLDFYMPIEGTGDRYRIAEISINNKIAYYCVADSLSNLKLEIQKKCNKHFPGLLNLRNVEIKYTTDKLVYSSVAGILAKNAFLNIPDKKINGVEIPAYISIPNDAELMPIIDMGKGNIKNLKIGSRGILAKYEIIAITSKYCKVENARIVEKGDDIFWEIVTDNGVLYLNPNNDNKINNIIEKQIICK